MTTVCDNLRSLRNRFPTFLASIYLDFTFTLLMPSAFGLKFVIIERSMVDEKGVRVIKV